VARIPYPELAALNDKVRTRVEQLPPLNILRMLSHAQANFVPFLAFGSSILTEQELDGKLRELAILRVAHLTGANYEWTQHVPIALQCGASEAQVAAISDGAASTAFNDLEQKVLAFTDELTLNVRVSDTTFQALAALLPPRQLVELTLATSFYGLAARVMEVFEIELEPTAGTYSLEQLQPKKG
jgi:4-carboxymuconolactone decarboxylase